MPVEFEWDNPEKTIGYYRFMGQWKWDEFWVVLNKVSQELDGLNHQVHFISHFMESVGPYYAPGQSLQNIIKIYRTPHPRGGVTVIVGAGPTTWSFYSMLRRIYPRIAERFIFADSVEEARTIIQQLRDQTT